MPLFFFHLRDSAGSVNEDWEGSEFPDVEAAYLDAYQVATDMAREWLKKGRNPRGYVFEVVTASGEPIFELPFSESLDDQAGRRPAHLSRAIRTAKERGKRMVRLSAEVARAVEAVRETLIQSQMLVKGLKRHSD